LVAGRPGTFVRDKRWIESLVQDPPHRRHGLSSLQCVVASRGGEPVGYALYRTKPQSVRPYGLPDGELAVVAQAALDPAANAAITRLLLSVDLMRRVRWWSLPVDTPLPHLLQDPRCLIVLHANAVELLVSGSGRRVSGLRVRCLGGKEATATVDTVALCLGGIESSRFLLNQTISPWNVSGLLGRHFQDHVQCFAGDVIGADLTAEDWPFGPWRLRGGAHLSKINLSAEAQRAHRTLNVSGMIEFDDGVYPAMRTGIKLLTGPASAIGLREFVRMVPRAPGAIWHHFRSRSDPRFALPWAKPKLSVYSEQSPLSESRIELSDARDPLGLRRARLTWAISELELHTIRTYVSLVRQAFAAKGLGEIVPDPDLMRDRFADRLVDLFHHCGGTRMSPDPRQGVVDTDLKLHGVENVYVCSSSVFPTSGFTNPTHTIMALAIRLADRLSELAALHRAA